MSASPPLSGYVVVDLSTGVAGAYCARLLADGGAEVWKAEPPGGDPLRRWTASGAEVADGEDGALFAYLATSTRSVVVDPADAAGLDRLHELLARADAVVWSRGTPLAEHPSLAPAALLERAPHLTVTAITPFGLGGPWSDRPATELTLQAWSGGVIGLGRGAPGRPPVSIGGQVGEWLTGAYAAIGTLAARARGLVDGPGELVDVSMLEAIALCCTYEPVPYVDMVGRPFRTGRSIVTPGVETTKDGLVGLGVGTGQQWLDFCVMVEHPEWMEDRRLFADRRHLAPEIAAWARDRTTDEVLELARAFRIPHAPIGNGATVPRTDHFVARGSLVPNPGTGVAEPAPPYRFDPPLLAARTPAPRPGADRVPEAPEATTQPRVEEGRERPAEGTPPLAGLRVLDLTAFWAGPLCTHLLALLGASVVHVESTARPDGTRLLAGLRPSEPDWWERSGIFAGLNSTKQGVTLDLGQDEGRAVLRRLLATCDVVVENHTPRVLDQLGLGIDEVRAIRPDVVFVRMPGFGLDGPWRDEPAFAFVIEDAAGLTWRTGHPDANPVSPYCVGDSNAGLHALCGLLLALEHRRRTGEGVVVEAAMVDAALAIAAEQVVEHGAYGALLERQGNRGPAAAPQNLYRTADVGPDGEQDTWVAIAVATDDQWTALRGALGEPAWAADPDLCSAAGRRAAHDRIDEELAAWCGTRAADDIVAALWPAGVPVAKVLQPHEQVELEQLRHRGFFEEVEHPVAGPVRHSTLPFRLSRSSGPVHLRHAPLLGEHNELVLGALGLGDDELAALEAAGVIGRVPVAAQRGK